MVPFAMIVLFAASPAVKADELDDNLKALRDESKELQKRADELERDRQQLFRDWGKERSPQAPPGLKGRVVEVKDDFLLLNIGIDAGLQHGMTLTIRRDDVNDKRELGTVTILRSYPKESVAKFTPAGGKTLKDLKPEERPKATDLVQSAKK